MEHNLKCWPEFFLAIVAGRKMAELRKDDRNFVTGDILVLREFDPMAQKYTGSVCRRLITHILRHRPGSGCAAEFGLTPGYAILSISPE